MYSEGELSFRLTYMEIVYLTTCIGYSEVYGLRHERTFKDPSVLQMQWNAARADLEEKKLLRQRDGNVVINSDIYEIIKAISKPRLFLVARSKDELIDCCRNYYFADHIAVKLEYDNINPGAYMLTSYDDPKNLKESLQDFFKFYSRPFAKTEQTVCFGIDELKDFLQAITDNDSDIQQDILCRQGVDVEYINDITKALYEKMCMRTMLVISFSAYGQKIVREYIIYGGAKYIWQIEFKDTIAYITGVTNNIIDYKMSVLSDLLFYL